MLLCFKNNLLACEALVQFADSKQRQNVRDGVFLTLENAISAKIGKTL